MININIICRILYLILFSNSQHLWMKRIRYDGAGSNTGFGSPPHQPFFFCCCCCCCCCCHYLCWCSSSPSYFFLLLGLLLKLLMPLKEALFNFHFTIVAIVAGATYRSLRGVAEPPMTWDSAIWGKGELSQWSNKLVLVTIRSNK